MGGPNASAVDALGSLSHDSYRREQVQLLYKGLPLSLISSLIIALLLSVSHLPVVGQAEIIIWNLILGATLIARLTLWQFWLNALQLYQPSLWLLLFRIGAWCTGAAWGAAAVLIYADDNATYQALLSFSLAGVASGSLTSLSADRISALGFALLAICPLTFRIIVDDSPTVFAMSVMTILFTIFIISGSGRTEQELRKQIQQNEILLALSQELQSNRDVDAIVTKAQSQFIADKNHLQAMQFVIDNTINITQSEMGFIGEVHYDDENKPYMKIVVYAYRGDEKKFDFFHQQLQKKPQEFRNLNGLFGNIMTSGKPIFCKNPRQDIRSVGMPDKHPDIHNFTGMPVFRGNELLAILCLANAEQPYENKTVALLNPITGLIAQFMHTLQLQRQHHQDIAVLQETTQQTQTIMDDIADGIIIFNPYGIIKSFNKAAETIFGYKVEQIIGESFLQLMPEPWRTEYGRHIRDFLQTGKSTVIGIGRELTGLRRNGKDFSMDLMMSKITREGEPMLIAIIRDISEKKLIKEINRNLIQNLSRELRIPMHAISLSLNMLEKNVVNDKHTNSNSLIKTAYQQTFNLHKTIKTMLQDNFSEEASDTHSPRILKAVNLIESRITRYKHIAEIRGSRFSLINRIYDEHILIDEDLFESRLVYLLELAAEYHNPFSEIKIFVEQLKGRIRIYFIDKSGQAEQQLINQGEWLKSREILSKMNGQCDIEPMTKENLKTGSTMVFMEFPLAVNKPGY